MRRRFGRGVARAIIAAMTSAIMGIGAAVADTYPSRAIKLIVPYSAGGASDISARYIASKLSQSLGQSIVIENQPSAAGVVAYGTAAKSAPDGYTLLFATASLATTKALRAGVSYDPLTDFAPITTLLDIQSVLVTRPKLAVNSVKDLVELAKQRKGELTSASLGQGSEPHLMMELFKYAAKVDIQPIPFKLTPQIFTEMMSDRVDLLLGLMPSVLPFVRDNRLKALGVSGATRSPALPDTPTIREAGVNGFAQTFWSGLMAPKGTPPDVIEKLHKAATAVINDPEVKAWALNLGAETRPSTPAEFSSFLREQVTGWTKLSTELGLKIE